MERAVRVVVVVGALSCGGPARVATIEPPPAQERHSTQASTSSTPAAEPTTCAEEGLNARVDRSAEPQDPAATLNRCTDGDAPACDVLDKIASRWDPTKGRSLSDERVTEAFRTACEKRKLQDACTMYARQLALGRGIASAPEKAMPLLKAPCDGGDARACSQLAMLLKSKEPTRARDLFKRACDSGRENSCYHLATALAEGTLGAADVTQASALLTAGCDRNHAASCGDLANLVARAPSSDMERVRALRLKACRLGVASRHVVFERSRTS